VDVCETQDSGDKLLEGARGDVSLNPELDILVGNDNQHSYDSIKHKENLLFLLRRKDRSGGKRESAAAGTSSVTGLAGDGRRHLLLLPSQALRGQLSQGESQEQRKD
jgi:hypothetical protein